MKKNYEDFQNHISDMGASLQTTREHLNQLHSDLNKQKLIKKYCHTYRTTKKIIQSEKFSDNPARYKQEHSAEYALHQSTANELKALGINKLPKSERLDKIIHDLENELSATKKEIQQLQSQQKNLNIVKENFQQLLTNSTLLKSESQLTEQHL